MEAAKVLNCSYEECIGYPLYVVKLALAKMSEENKYKLEQHEKAKNKKSR